MWRVEVALEVLELDQLGQLALRRRLELPAVLAQLGLDVLHAQQLVDLFLGGAGVGLAGGVDLHAVLGDVEPAAHRIGPQRLVVLLRAGEVLEQVAEVLGRHDPQVHAEPVVGAGPHAGGSGLAGLLDQRHPAEGLGQGLRVGGGGNDVQVLAAVGQTAGAAGDLHAVGSWMLAQGVAQLDGHLQRAREHDAPTRARLRQRGDRVQDVLLGLCAEAREVTQAVGLGGLLELVKRLHAQLVVELAHLLGAQPRHAGDLEEPDGELGLELVGRGDRARLHQHLDLLGDGLAHTGQLLRPALPRHLGHGHRRVPDGLGRVAVGQHAMDDRAVQLVQVGQLAEGVGYLGVAHVRL